MPMDVRDSDICEPQLSLYGDEAHDFSVSVAASDGLQQ